MFGWYPSGEGGSHHATSHGGAAQGVVLGEAGTTQLQREEVRDGGLANQGVKEGLQHLIRLREREKVREMLV